MRVVIALVAMLEMITVFAFLSRPVKQVTIFITTNGKCANQKICEF